MPLFWLALAFATGITLAANIQLPWLVWIGFCLVCGTAYLLRRRQLPNRVQRGLHWLTHEFHGSMLSPLAVLVALLLGGLRYELAQPRLTSQNLAFYNGSGYASITGIVDAPPGLGSGRVPLRLSAREIQFDKSHGPIAVEGKLITYAPAGSQWQYGDRVLVKGRPENPPDEADFSYRDYLARQGIYTWVQYGSLTRLASGQGKPFFNALYGFRQHALAMVFQLFPAPESSLLAGILLGDDGFLPDDLMQAYKDTGTAHIIAISGFNIAILAGLFAVLFSRLFGGRWGSLAAILAISLYTLLVGAEGSVVRSAIMGGAGLLAAQLGRRQVGYNTLGMAALLMIGLNPGWLTDVGFQLSFMATFGLVTFAERFQQGVQSFAAHVFQGSVPQGALDMFAEYVLFTLAAQLTTWPVQVYYFRQFSLVSLIANPLILPPQSLIMVLGGLATLGGMLLLPLGQVLAAVAWPFVAYSNRVVEFLSGFHVPSVYTGPVNPFVIGLYYVILVSLVAYGRQLLPRLKTVAPSAAIFGLAALSALTWRTVALQVDQNLRLTLLPGEGNPALLVQAPGGQTILVNGGSSAPSLARSLGERLPPFQHHLDGLVLTRTTQDSFGALPETLRLYSPGLALWLVDPYENKSSQAVQAVLGQVNITPEIAQPGMQLALDQSVRLNVLGELGNEPTGLMLEWKNFRALLPMAKPQELPVHVDGISLLILDSGNLKVADAETWQAVLNPQVLIYAGQTGAVPAWALDTRSYHGLKISTDGTQLWVEGGK